MGIPGNSDILIGFSEGNQSLLETVQTGYSAGYCFLSVEPQVKSHLVVTGAGGVELATYFADHFNEPGFDIHVDIFQFRLEGKFALLYFVIVSASFLEIIPCFASILAWAIDPAMS